MPMVLDQQLLQTFINKALLDVPVRDQLLVAIRQSSKASHVAGICHLSEMNQLSNNIVLSAGNQGPYSFKTLCRFAH